MSSSKDAEEEYMRMRMKSTKISDDHQSETPAPEANPLAELDDTITADEALTLKEEGNTLYKCGNFAEAINKYSLASSSAHASPDDRAVYFANRAAAHLKLQNFEQVVEDSSSALELKPGYVKALSRRREAREALKEWRGALKDAQELKAPSSEIQRLQFLADEKDKKDQAEALESLKGLGNSILSNFGMSLDDFAMDKDPDSGSYSIRMKQ
ncbi:translocase [Gracilaria domingensis]|nr:translocase [Gracilaria domingensis]